MNMNITIQSDFNDHNDHNYHDYHEEEDVFGVGISWQLSGWVCNEASRGLIFRIWPPPIHKFAVFLIR